MTALGAATKTGYGNVVVLRVPSILLAARQSVPVPPAAITVLWHVAHAINAPQGRLALEETIGVGTWIHFAAKALKPPGQRSNRWLFRCLSALSKCELSGVRNDEPWQSVLISEWRSSNGGTEIHILLPPSAAEMFKTKSTYAQIESSILHGMPRVRHAQKLFGVLSDRRRQDQKHWTYTLEELREVLDLRHQAQYSDWTRLKQKVLEPALNTINRNSTVQVTMTAEKLGRRVIKVRFDWDWDAQTARPPAGADPSPETATTVDLHDDTSGTEDANLEYARRWWGEQPRKTRINTLLNLGIQRPTAADLSDDTPQIQNVSHLLVAFRAPPDVRAQRAAERGTVREPRPTEAEEQFERLLDGPPEHEEDGAPEEPSPEIPATSSDDHTSAPPEDDMLQVEQPTAQTSGLPFPAPMQVQKPPDDTDVEPDKKPPDQDQISWFEAIIGG